MRLIEENQFDTIYHEHFSLFLVPDRARACSRRTGSPVRRRGAADAWRLAAHLRLPTTMTPTSRRPRGPGARRARAPAGYEQLDTYRGLRRAREQDKRHILSFLIDLKRQGMRIAGYGAPGQGQHDAQLLRRRHRFLDYTCDLNPHKQGHFLPGSHIPIRAPDRLAR